LSQTLENRFWAKVVRGPECWEWQAAKGGDGYGALKVAGRMERAHRVSWFLETGTWPEGELRHVCSNRSCVRPDHLVQEKLPAHHAPRGRRGTGHVERRGKGWRIIVTAGRDPVTGKVRRISRTVYVANELEARTEAARMLTEVVDGKHEVTGKHTFGELLDAWLGHVRPSLEPGTAALYEYAVGYVTAALRGKAVTKVTTEDLDALYRWLLDHGSTGGGNANRRGKPLSAKSVRHVHSVIRLALAQGKKWHWLTSNVALDATPPAPRKRQVTPPSPDVLLRLLSFIEGTDGEFFVFLRLASTAGPRRGELCALRWSAVDLERGTVHVIRRIVWNRGERRWEERQSTKTGRDRALVLGPRTLELLRSHRVHMLERARACGTRLRDDAFLFSDVPDGSEPWSPARMTRMFGAFRDRAGVPSSLRLHDLRAFVSTQLQEGGHPLPVVAGRLGHAQYSTTLDHWS
jgi:integrase